MRTGLVLVGLILATSGRLPADVRSRIESHLERAAAAESIGAGQEALREAEALIAQSGKQLGAIVQAFYRAESGQASGRLYAAHGHRDKARRTFLLALDDYELLIRQCEHRLDVIEQNLGHRDPIKNKAWRQNSITIARANYGSAWASYRVAGLIDNPAERKPHLINAIERFGRFTEKGYRADRIVADCFVGQALSLHELGRHAEAAKLIEPATFDNTPRDLFQRITAVRIKAYQALNQHEQAEHSAAAYFNSLAADHTLDAGDLSIAIERTRSLAALADPKHNPKGHRAYRSQLERIVGQICRYGQPWASQLAERLDPRFVPATLGCLVRARKHFRARRFEQALAEAERGLKTPHSGQETFLADLRYARTAACWNLHRWSEAFEAGFEFLTRHGGDPRAGSLCGQVMQAGLRALRTKPPVTTETFLRFLDFAEKHFPNADEMRKARWYRGYTLLQAGRCVQAERLLETVRADSPVYPQAQYGLALAAYKQAQTTSDGRHLMRSASAVERFAKAASREPALATAVVDVGTAVVDRLLDLPEPDVARATHVLKTLDHLPAASHHRARQREALKIELAITQGQADNATARLNRLLAGNRSAERVAAITALADRLERRRDQANRVAEHLVMIYRTLLNRSDTEDGATAMRERLANALVRTGRPREAIDHYRVLVQHLPRAKSAAAWRGLGLAYEACGDYGGAIEAWRVPAKGLPQGSNGWTEARYHLIRSHLMAGHRDHARKLFKLFRLQHPQITAATWRERFAGLKRELGADAPTTSRATDR